ncbi:hypothetical protein RDV89_08730 [Nocardioides zeae]|uniref:EamA family transporter n=1 Tax=Nocardioides imazamoxiresistens TaxID=3231893 RepID=A0ABU3PW88_9ACTN|nr:hypothetical protein [Nocardioides zeae]MDT9593151.1 hypothetical protein [Nocardioides zeae]
MTLAVVLVLVGSCAHAAWNLLAVAGRTDPRGFLLAATLVALAACAPLAIVRLAAGGTALADLRGALVLGAVSGLLHTAYALSLQVAYRHGDVGVVYPVARGVGPLLAVVAGWVLFSEAVTGVHAAGVGLVLTGVAVAAAEEQRSAPVGPGDAGSAGPAVGSAGAGLVGGLVVGTAVAAYTVWDAHAVGDRGADPVAYYLVTGLVQLLVLLAVSGAGRARRVREVVRTTPLAVVGVGLLVPTSYLLVLFAMTMAPLSVVAPLRATSVVIGAVGACVLLREGRLAPRLAAAAVVAAGVTAVGL